MRSARTYAAVGALGALGLALAFYPTLGSGFSQMQRDPMDTRHLNFVLENGYRWLTGDASLFSPNMFYPLTGVAAYTEVLLGVLPFYLPFRALGLEPDTAFQCWMLLVAALNYLAALLLLRRGLGFGWLGTAMGAFLIPFGSPRLAQLGHQHLIPHFFTLLSLYGLANLFHERGSARRAIALFAGGLVLQAYAGIYFAWFLGFALGIAFAAALAMRSTRPALLATLKRHRVTLALAAVVSSAAVVPLALPYLQAASAVGYRSFSEVVPMLPRLQSWIYLGDRSVLYGGLAFTALYGKLPNWWEQAIGIGFLTLPLCAYSLWRGREKPLLRVLAVTTLTLVLLTMCYRGRWSPWWLVFEAVPGAAALRAVSRIGLLLLIPWGIALASWLDRTATTRRGLIIAVLISAAVIAEQMQQQPSYDKAELRAEVAALAAKIPRECDAFYFSPRSTQRYEQVQLDAMWAGLLTGKRCVNGYSSNFPPGFELKFSAWTDETKRDELDAALRAWERLHGLPDGSICTVR